MVNRAEEPVAATSAAARVAPFLEWPRGVARLGVVVCVALTAAFSVVYLVKAVDRLGEIADTNASVNFDDREFAGGNSLVVEQAALYEARALIPEHETYRVVTGSPVEGATELTEPHIEQYARYFLLPRKTADDARWILCYGCDLAAFGDGVEILWRSDSGISVARLPA